jgi:ADP-ribosyl-[dinitrogen reductase] hydrolase
LAKSLVEARSLSVKVSEVTHNHPEGIRGAAATASAVYLARNGSSAEEIRSYITEEFGYDLVRTVDEIRPGYVFNETCQRSVPEALTCALEAMSFEDAIRNAISIGGDSDTIAAIAGGVAEARFGIPEALAADAWARLPIDMRKVLAEMYTACVG